MLNSQFVTDTIMLRDSFVADIESPAKKAIARIIVWVFCFLGLTVTFILAARIILLVFMVACILINYIIPIPFLTG